MGEQILLFVLRCRLQIVNLLTCTVLTAGQTGSQIYQPDRQDQQNLESSVQSLPNGGSAARAEIGVS